MNFKRIAIHGRAWTAALLAASVIGTTTFSASFARADDEVARPPERAEGAGTSPNRTGDERTRRPDDDPSRRVVIEYRSPSIQRAPDWQEGEPIPPGYHPVQRVRKGPVIAGACTFGILYLISVLVAAAGTDVSNSTNTNNSVWGLYVPVVGPFITMTQSSTAVGNVFLVIDGAGQAAGAVLLLYGIVSPQTVLVRDDYGRPKLLPQPMLFGKSGGGIGLTGTF
jgi:hypothetical protein